MRPLNENELVQYINWLKDRVLGAQLQDIVGDRERIVLELYRYRLFWIVIDLRRARPLILFCEEKPPISKQTTPLGLFLAGHAEGLFLERIQLNEKLGRVVELEFCKGERSVSLELTLIPHAPNAIARADEKKISFYRPKDLAEKEGLPPFTAVGGRTSADFEKFEKLYFYPAPEEALPDAAQPKTQKDTTGIAAFIQKNQQLIKKKEEALRKLNEIDFDPEIELNFQVGEKLKTHEPLAAGEEAIFDTRLSRSENMRKLFAQAKRLREKKEGLAARKTVLNSEIGRLKTLLADPQINIGHLPNVVSSSPRVAHDLKPGKEIKVRTLRLREGRMARFGKSATDNLKLLREARAWDIWVHLRDEPSAHGIVFCEKNRPPTDEELCEVGRWIFRDRRHGKILATGLRVSLIVCECRFVRPIRGDRHGRVTHAHGRTLEFSY